MTPRLLWIGLGAILLIAAVLAERTAFGNRRFHAGEDHADEQWKKASDKLIAKAQKEAGRQDSAAAARAADFAAKQEDEKERIDAATAKGSSTFDELFGVSNAN